MILSLGPSPDANGLAFDAVRDLWVANASPTGTLTEYAPTQLVTGSPTPSVVESIPYEHGASQLAFDSAGDLWFRLDGSPGAAQAVAEFAPAQLRSSSSVPNFADLIIGPDTGFTFPEGLVIEEPPTVSSISQDAGPAGAQITIHGTGFVPGRHRRLRFDARERGHICQSLRADRDRTARHGHRQRDRDHGRGHVCDLER